MDRRDSMNLEPHATQLQFYRDVNKTKQRASVGRSCAALLPEFFHRVETALAGSLDEA